MTKNTVSSAEPDRVKGTGIVLRRLSEADLEAAWHMRLEMLAEAAEAYASTYDETLARGREPLRERLAGEAESFYIGAFDGHLIGLAAYYRAQRSKERHNGYMVSVYVAPAARGKGAGKALVEAVIAEAKKQEGLEQIHVGVVATAAAARHVYEWAGFKKYGTEPHALRAEGQYWDMDEMVLRLPVGG